MNVPPGLQTLACSPVPDSWTSTLMAVLMVPFAWSPTLSVSLTSEGLQYVPAAQGQGPQSCEHDMHVSDPLHEPSPHCGAQGPQSSEHDMHVSGPLHEPSPHCGAQGP